MLLERKVKTRIIRKHPILFNTIRFLLFPVSLAKEKFRRQVEKYLRRSNDLLEITHRGSLSGDQKFKWCYEVAWHKSFIKTTFEDMEINIPCGYHDILSKAYGNYMEFPPKEDQQPMHGLSYVIDCGEEKYE